MLHDFIVYVRLWPAEKSQLVQVVVVQVEIMLSLLEQCIVGVKLTAAPCSK